MDILLREYKNPYRKNHQKIIKKIFIKIGVLKQPPHPLLDNTQKRTLHLGYVEF